MTRESNRMIRGTPRLVAEMALRGERSAVRKIAPSAPPTRSGDQSGIGERGFIRPGHDVRVVDHAPNAVRVTSSTRLKPGVRTDLHLLEKRRTLTGEFQHCRVSQLDPICYEAIFVF
jgi:hypothetical protein